MSVRKKRLLFVVAALSAVALISGACAREGGGGAQAGDCSSEGLQALGAPRPNLSGEFKLAKAKDTDSSLLAQGKKTVKLGVFGDLTGQNSQLVVHIRNAAIMAAEQANAAGDLPVTIAIEQYDNKDGGPDPAPALAQKAIGDPAVLGIIGPAFSGETEAAAPLFAQAGLTTLSASATRTDLTTKGWRTFFRAVGNDDSQGEIGPMVVDTMGCEKVALVDDKSAYGAGLAAVVEQSVEGAGGEIALREGIEPTTDYTSLVDSLLAEDPDLVYYAGYSSQSSLVVKQYREKGGEAVFMTGDGSKDTVYLEQGQPGNDESLLTCPCGDATQSDDAKLQEFASEYQERFDEPAGVYGAEGWDVAQMFIAALKAGGANPTRASVLEHITNLKDFAGITKTFNWTTPGHEVAEENLQIYGYRVDDGKYILLGTIEELSS
ncbi:MAG: branched-chain amino acid ABC transporter substrate-binding protein [Actinomycetota bacterium]